MKQLAATGQPCHGGLNMYGSNAPVVIKKIELELLCRLLIQTRKHVMDARNVGHQMKRIMSGFSLFMSSFKSIKNI